MIPIAWVESAGLGIKDTDYRGVVRHTWQVVYRCPGCSSVDVQPFPARKLSMSGNPAPLDTEAIRVALAGLTEAHRCAVPSLAKEPPC